MIDKTLSHYRLVEKIGEGGMAGSYDATVVNYQGET